MGAARDKAEIVGAVVAMPTHPENCCPCVELLEAERRTGRRIQLKWLAARTPPPRLLSAEEWVGALDILLDAADRLSAVAIECRRAGAKSRTPALWSATALALEEAHARIDTEILAGRLVAGVSRGN